VFYLKSALGYEFVFTSLVLGGDGWVQWKDSRAVLPLTQHHCSIHCESSRVAHGAE